nr:MAG: hypothetical protein [Betatorquevirus sp.]
MRKRPSSTTPNTPRKLQRNIVRGRNGNTTPKKAPQTQKATQATTPAAPPTKNHTNLICVHKVQLFPPKKPKNRRFTQAEMEDEKYIASWLKRPQRHFFYDPPTYPWLPPEPYVNFDLNWKK